MEWKTRFFSIILSLMTIDIIGVFIITVVKIKVVIIKVVITVIVITMIVITMFVISGIVRLNWRSSSTTSVASLMILAKFLRLHFEGASYFLV